MENDEPNLRYCLYAAYIVRVSKFRDKIYGTNDTRNFELLLRDILCHFLSESDEIFRNMRSDVSFWTLGELSGPFWEIFIEKKT